MVNRSKVSEKNKTCTPWVRVGALFTQNITDMVNNKATVCEPSGSCVTVYGKTAEFVNIMVAIGCIIGLYALLMKAVD